MNETGLSEATVTSGPIYTATQEPNTVTDIITIQKNGDSYQWKIDGNWQNAEIVFALESIKASFLEGLVAREDLFTNMLRKSGIIQ